MTGVLHIVLARKPLEGTVAENCLQWGCGALWIDGTRVGGDTKSLALDQARRKTPRTKITGGSFHSGGGKSGEYDGETSSPSGRWPANLIHDGSDKVLALFPQNIPPSYRNARTTDPEGSTWSLGRTDQQPFGYADSGSAARFFFSFGDQESDE